MGMAMPIIAIAGMAMSTAASGIGAMRQGQATAASANYQAQVARNNAVIAQQNADAERAAGHSKEQRHRMEVKRVIGEQLAAQGASGFDVNTGSAVDVRAGTAGIGELDALTIRYNADLKARDFENQKRGFLHEAEMKEAEASAAKKAGMLQMATTFLGGSSKIASAAFKFNQAGAFGGSGSSSGKKTSSTVNAGMSGRSTLAY